MNKLKKYCPVILGNKVRLRLIQQADIEILRHWRNENRFAFFDSSYISAERQQKWFEHYWEKEDDLIFIIETPDAKPIGTISLYRIDLSSMRTKFGRMIIGDIKSRKKGFARDASEGLIRFAFSTMNLRQLSLGVFKNNERAIKLYEKIGFRKVQVPEDDHAFEKTVMILDKDTYLNLRQIRKDVT